MSLDWNTRKCINSDALFVAEKPIVLLETAIFMCSSVGFGSITKKNYKEWFRRIWHWEAVRGAARTDNDGEPVFFTEANVYRLIGLSTNADDLTKAKFNSKIKDIALRDAVTRCERMRGEKAPG